MADLALLSTLCTLAIPAYERIGICLKKAIEH
jgi:hypothetical protein